MGPKQPIYLVIGSPASGKSYVCEKLKDKFHYVSHDDHIYDEGGTTKYLNEIIKKAKEATKPLLIEAPFSISQTKDPLEQAGYKVIPIFIIESEPVLRDRYWKRERKEIPKGHLTRTRTYKQRATEWNAFQGTSQQVLDHLTNL